MHRSLLVQFLTPGNKQTSFRSTKRGLKRTKKIIAKYHLPPSIACKVCENSVKKRVINFWKNLGIFNPIQFGFLEGKSTAIQLLTCYNDWASSRDKSTPTDVIFLDFIQVFHSVLHERLLLKLKGYGIEGSLLQWFRIFLTNRQQRLVLGSTFSSWTRVRSGVPQGTILGSILFLIYVNDVSSNISSSIKMFADDTKVYREIADFENDTRALQTDIVRLANWQHSGNLGSTQRNAIRCA